ncbi:prolipoprotein diacylglyceryl transferase family protein, partial [Alcanivorax sp. HI0083]
MDAVIIGPLALPAGTFVVLTGFFAASLTSLWWQRRGQRIEATLWLIAITAVLGARLAFVWRYQNQYDSWLAMLDIRDGGWWWPGALVALAV